MSIQKNEIMSKRKVLQLSATFFITILFVIGCKKESNIGDGLQSENLNLLKTDTFTLVTYSEIPDSIETDETSVNLLGFYNDPVFGSVDCGFATQIRLSSENPDLKSANIASVDSVVLALDFTSINYYANQDSLTFEVYEITEDLVRTDQDYYGDDIPMHTGNNLVLAGSETEFLDYVKYQVVGSDTLDAHLRIRLDPSLGYQFRDLADAGSLSTDESFVQAFKGLYVKVSSMGVGPQEGTIGYFSLESTISNLTMYFTDILAAPQFYTFNINSLAARYNTLTFDRTGTKVEALLGDSTLGKEEFYMQGSSIWTVIHIPYLEQFYLDANGEKSPKIINKAELILPIQDFQPDVFDPPTSLFLAKIVNATTSDFTLDYDYQSTINGNTVTYDEDAKQFRFIMTQEVQAILNGTRENTGFRIYVPSFYGSSIERVIFNGPNSLLKDRARLEITYTEY